jgi:hypothetical protein
MRIIVAVFFCLFLFRPASANIKDTLPVPPANLRCSEGKMGYGLYWIDKSNNEVRFKVYRAVSTDGGYTLYAEVKSSTAETAGTEYFCKIENSPGNFSFFSVTAISKAGEGGASNVAVMPKMPQGLTGTADSIAVTLNWNIPADSWIQMIFVERSESPADGFKIMSPIVGMNRLNFIDYSVDKRVDYYYRVRGVYYDSQTKGTSYTLPSGIIGPFRIPGRSREYDGEINYSGRNYQYKTFGSQTWMIENLAYLPEVYPSSSACSSANHLASSCSPGLP